MSTVTGTPSSVTSPTLSPPHFRPMRFDDYDEVRRLVLSHGSDLPPVEDWHSLWLENPLHARLGRDVPIGWVLETAKNEIVGTMGTVLTRYTLRGSDLINAIGRAWFVAAPYRGYALQLMAEYFSQPGVDLFINNSVSRAALKTFAQLSAPVPVGNWETMPYWVTGYHEFAMRALRKMHAPPVDVLAYPAGAALWLKDAVWNKRFPNRGGSFDIEVTARFDSRFDVFWEELLREYPETLLAVRNTAALSWHFAIPMRRRRIWIVTACRKNSLRAYCILTRQDHGFRLPALPRGQGLRALRLVDYQSIERETDALISLLPVALRVSATAGLSIFENLGTGVPKMRALDEFAPYRQKLENWKFFYHATDPALDAELSDPKFWDPSAFDGDASFE